MKKALIVSCVVLILSSCTWVKVTPKGDGVRLVPSNKYVAQCKNLGKVNAKVVSQIIFERNPDKVAEELANMARNEAAGMGADTIVPISEIVDGRRVFGAYQCFHSNRIE